VADNDHVSLGGAIAIGIGGMVGGGIFAVLGVVAVDAGAGTPVAFLIAGVVALLTGYCYTKLSVALPSGGGTVVFVDRAFGTDLLSGSVNVLLWLGYLVTVSLYAVAFANYGATFFVGDQPPGWLLLHGLITAAVLIPALINLLNAALVARTETIVVVVKLIVLAIVTVAGWRFIDFSRLAPSDWPSIPAIAAAGMLIFVAYEGFELIANSGDDVDEVSGTLGKAFYIAIATVIVLYVLIAIVTVGNLSSAEIADYADFALAKAAEPSLGQLGFTLVAASAVLATFSAINASLYGSARLSASIAVEGELPEELEQRVWNQPVGLLITAGGSLLLANTLDLTAISTIASAGFLLVFGAVNAACFKLSSSIGASRIISGAAVAGCLGALVALVVKTIQDDPANLLVLVAMALAALIIEWTYLKSQRSRRGLSRMNLVTKELG
jgi:amino acid transporter